MNVERIRRVICVESVAKYQPMLNVLKDRYTDLQVVMSIDMLEKEMLSNKKSDITIVFLDNGFVHKISKEMQYQFNYDNNICIVISEGAMDSFKRAPYIYDILEYKDSSTIYYFLKRLEKDMDYRIQLLSAISDVKEFSKVGQKLASEKNVDALMELIIDASIKMTSADAGSLYIIVSHEKDKKEDEWSFYENDVKNKYLKFIIAKNKSIKLKLQSSIIPILKDSIVGHSVLTGKPVRIEDAYNMPQRFEFKLNSKFDDLTGYKTKGILTVPMKDHQNRILGVIQLINKRENGETIPFTFKDEVTIYSLAGQASIALENNILYKNMENLISKYKETIDEEITKRSETDEEINKLLGAIQHSPITVIITDKNGYIQYVNPKFTELTGYEYKEMIGRKPNAFNAEYHREGLLEQLWMQIMAGEGWSGEFRNKKKNNDHYWESVSISSLKDNNGDIKYIILVVEDITQKKLMTTDLEYKNIQLSETIQKLEETQLNLIQKEKMAGIGHLAAGIAHEINSPLAFILSNNRVLMDYMIKYQELLLFYQNFIKNNIICETLEEFREFEFLKKYEEDNNLDLLAEDLIKLFDDTSDGLEKVKEIVEALKRFATIDSMREYEEYDLIQGIRSCVIVLKHEMTDIYFSEELDEAPALLAIGGEMNQVILNLISNSIYAIKQRKDKNQGQIKIKTWYEPEKVFCEIEDNGIGIEEMNMKNIFNPFYTTKPEGSCMGIGLAIAYDVIVKKHAGEIFASSMRGEGTKITIQLPLQCK